VVRVGLPTSPLALFQTVEYLRAFLMARVAWSRIGALTVVSGAFGLFRRSAAVAVGGYSLKTVGEDAEIVFKIERRFRDLGREARIVFLPEPVCWTEVPSDLGTLARQRQRWQRGSLETLSKHRDMFRPRYGRFGILGVGQAILSDVIAPPVEVLGYLLMPVFYALGMLSWEVFAAFLAVTFGFGVALSVGALALEEIELRRYPRARDLAILTAAAVAENFGYRQLNNWWRLKGYWQWLRKAEGWGHMRRTGFKRV
jgi:cellulose synthase/poly-beta-1,6-N-acetylglucosamine synthase-like glycosyltransferase